MSCTRPNELVVNYGHCAASDWSYDCRAPLALPSLGRPSSKHQPQFLCCPNPNFNYPSHIDGRSQTATMTLSRPNGLICVTSTQAYMDASLKTLLVSVSPRRYKMSYVPTSCIANLQCYHYLSYLSRIILHLLCEPLQCPKHNPRRCQPCP